MAIVESVSALAYHPKMGRPGRDETTRELVVSRTPYIAALPAAATRRNRDDPPCRPKVAGKLRLKIAVWEAAREEHKTPEGLIHRYGNAASAMRLSNSALDAAAICAATIKVSFVSS